MISISEFFVLVFLVVMFAYWLDGIRKKEIASDAAKKWCQKAQVQFLDDTVRLTGIRLKRNSRGRIALMRTYQFEFTMDSSSRETIQITLLNARIWRMPDTNYFLLHKESNEMTGDDVSS